MSNNRILYVCQEIAPYLPENEESLLCRTLSQACLLYTSDAADE